MVFRRNRALCGQHGKKSAIGAEMDSSGAPAFPETLHLADYFLFERLAEGLGHKTAILYGERAYSYEYIAQRTRQTCSLFTQATIRRGERVLIVLPDTPPFAWVFFGTLAMGAVVVIGNPDS